jgi:predicted dehydrogenase
MPTKKSPLSVALLGGGFGRYYHIPGLLAEPGRFKLTRFCDQDAATLKAVTEDERLKGIIGSSDYREALNDPAIDAVIISLPHHLHEPVAIAAAESGKHILVDKPIARTMEEANRMIAAAEKHGVTLMTAFNQRFETRFVKIQEQLKAGSLGRVLYATSNHSQNFGGNPTWRSKAAVGGGCVIGSGVHNLDLMRWFFGEAEEVFAYAAHDAKRLEAEVAVSASLKFKSGVVVNFICNWGVHGNHGNERWGIYGTEADLFLEDQSLGLGKAWAGKDLLTKDEAKAHHAMWAHFTDCIATGATPLTSGRDSAKSLELVLKIYESMETGRPAKI